MSDLSGIYIHIPYCKQICPYCDFNVYPQQQANWQGLSNALISELIARAHLFADKEISSVYFGGGTPSLAPLALVEDVLTTIAQHYRLESDAEITLEIDPATASREKCVDLLALGINRMSLGWQSMRASHLKLLGRSHQAEDNLELLESLRAMGLKNISCDLIFSLPRQSLNDLEQDLKFLLAACPEHISIYALTYHEGTPFYDWRNKGRLKPCSEDDELSMMRHIKSELEVHDYEHYEVSNYARDGFRSRHNQHYWHGRSYLGVGPGAESFLKENVFSAERWQTLKNPASYMHAWQEQVSSTVNPVEQVQDLAWHECLGARQIWNEKVLSGVRLAQGFDVGEFGTLMALSGFCRVKEKAVALGWLNQGSKELMPTSLGRENADALAELFFELVP
jgi:oxygen-independent coproporphyrinogen-3 oxidase